MTSKRVCEFCGTCSVHNERPSKVKNEAQWRCTKCGSPVTGGPKQDQAIADRNRLVRGK